MIQDYLHPNRAQEEKFISGAESTHFLKAQEGFSTKSIHFAQEPEMQHGSVNVPVHITSTYAQARPGQIWSKFDYSRCGNPTREILEKVLGHLENGKFVQTLNHFRSAVAVALLWLKHGDEVAVTADLDHDASDLMDEMRVKFKYRFHKVATWDHQAVETMLAGHPKIKMLWVQTPSYSQAQLSDIAKLSEVCKAKGVLLVVDNSLAGPVLCRPLDLGADLLVNRVDSVIAGHDDLLMGSMVTNDSELHDRLYLISKSYGGVSAPMNSYYCLRELKTMELRVTEMSKNAHVLAQYIADRPQVAKVFSASLPSDPNHQLMKAQMNQSPFRFAFQLKSGKTNLDHLVTKMDLFHYGDGSGAKSQVFIHQDMVVVTCGIEEISDLLLNVQQAFLYLTQVEEKQAQANKEKVLKATKKIKKADKSQDSKNTDQE